MKLISPSACSPSGNNKASQEKDLLHTLLLFSFLSIDTKWRRLLRRVLRHEPTLFGVLKLQRIVFRTISHSDSDPDLDTVALFTCIVLC